ncbi:cellulosome anchor protein [Gardnerella vaginalis]|uniref:cellulosome anchor protein n=1 Tax=Gardnerella vaginalis TaxID=2702 RepID=UPI000E20D913|nr:cellulosome anchor protein [Gardnerella vaginalis]RDW95591.1 cellulosome anchor protein [Gardnerella vaginalis]RDW95735.1 cellulosome anchor protein [Gardnerella vaginalis]
MKNKTLVAKKIALVVAGLSMAAPCFIAGAPAFADSYASVQRSTNVNLAKLYGTTDGVGLIYKHIDKNESAMGEEGFAFQLYYDMLMASNNTRMASKTGKLDAASEKLLNSIKEEIRKCDYRYRLIGNFSNYDWYLLEKNWKHIDAAKSPEELKKAYKNLTKDMRSFIRTTMQTYIGIAYSNRVLTDGMQNPKSNSFVDPTPTKSKFGNYDLSYLNGFESRFDNVDDFIVPAPASLSDVNPDLKGNLVLDKIVGAEAGMPSLVTFKTRRIVLSHPILACAYLYKGSVDDSEDAYGEKPVLLTDGDFSNSRNMLIGNNPSYSDDSIVSVSIPEGCHGLYTLLLVGDDGRQLGWTTINVDKEGESVGDISRGAALAAPDDESTPSDVTPSDEPGVEHDVAPSEDVTPSDFDFTPSFDVTPSEETPSDFDFTPSFDVTPSEETPSDFDFTPSFDVTPSEDVTPSDFDFTPSFDVTPSEETPSDFDFTPSFDVTPSEDTYTPSDFDFSPSFDVTPSEDTETSSDFDFTPSFDVTPSEDAPSDFDFTPSFDVTPSEDTPSDFDFSPSFDVTPSEDTPSDFDFSPSFDVTPSEDTYTPSDFDFTPSFDEAPSSDSDSNVMPSDFTFDYNFDAVDGQ